MKAPTHYPLTWPAGRPRRKPGTRVAGQFKSSNKAITIGVAARRLEEQVRLLGGKNLVISTGVQPTLTGSVNDKRGTDNDPGVCAFFQLGDKPLAVACDRYVATADNLAAIAAHLEATRSIERYGVQTAAEILQAFAALPAPSWQKPWQEVLGFKPGDDPTPTMIRDAHRRLSLEHHPDKGGTTDDMAKLNAARDQGLGEVGS